MHIKYTKINYTLKTMKNLHSEIVLRKDFSVEKFTETGKLFHYVYNTLCKEIATITGSTPKCMLEFLINDFINVRFILALHLSNDFSQLPHDLMDLMPQMLFFYIFAAAQPWRKNWMSLLTTAYRHFILLSNCCVVRVNISALC